MKSPERFSSVGVNLDGSIVYFRHSLYLNVVTPHSILPLVLDVGVEVILTSDYKLRKKGSLALYV
jgi:hypothetical protein